MHWAHYIQSHGPCAPIASQRPGTSPRAVACQADRDSAPAGNHCLVSGRAPFRDATLGLGLRRGLRRGGHGGRPGRLVCRGSAVPPPARPADPAHRDHPAQPCPYRREPRQLHRDQFPGARGGGAQAERGGFRRAGRGVAGRPRTQRPACRLRFAPAAAKPYGDRPVRPAALLRRTGAHRARADRSGAARRRAAQRRDREGPAPDAAQRAAGGSWRSCLPTRRRSKRCARRSATSCRRCSSFIGPTPIS